MSLRKRLEELEKRAGIGRSEDPDAVIRRRGLELLFRETDNFRREGRGEDPVPFTAQDRAFEAEQDRRFLEDGLMTYREDPGWQYEEAQAFLDELERGARASLQEG